jgi:hypothetical protein
MQEFSSNTTSSTLKRDLVAVVDGEHVAEPIPALRDLVHR